MGFNIEEVHKDFASIPNERLFQIQKSIAQGHIKEFHENIETFLNWNGKTDTAEGREYLRFLNDFVNNNIVEIPKDLFDGQSINNLDELKKHLLKECVDFSREQIQSLHAIAKGMDCTASEWDDLIEKGSAFIQERIEGSFSKQAIKEALIFKDISETVQTTITNWIDTKSTEELKHFLTYLSGSPAVPYEINIHTSNHPNPSVHACFSEIELAPNMSPDEIKLFLDDCCREHKKSSGFQVP